MKKRTGILRGIAVPEGTILHFGRTDSLIMSRGIDGVGSRVEWVPTTHELRRDARSHAPNSVAEHMQLPVQPTVYGPARLIGYSPTFGTGNRPVVKRGAVRKEIRKILRPLGMQPGKGGV